MKDSTSKLTVNGFSLFELLITIVIIAVLSAAAIPNFVNLIARNQVMVHANLVLESLYLARGSAITQQQIIQICRSSDSQTCHANYNANSNWSAGWLIFSDINKNNNFDSDDILLRHVDNKDQVNIVFNQRGRLRFFPDGSARSAGYYICDRRQKYYRHVYLLHSGRARISEQLSAKNKLLCDAVV